MLCTVRSLSEVVRAPPHLFCTQNPTKHGLLVYLRSLPPNKLCCISSHRKPSPSICAQNPTTHGLLVYLRSLPPNKLCTVCLMLVVGQLQGAAMLYIGAQLLFVLPWSNAVPSASVPHVMLLLVMLGVVLQVLGLAHLTIDAVPEERGSTPRTSPLLLSPQLSGISGMAEGHLASAFQNLTTPDDYNLSDDLPTLPSMQSMDLRLDALAKFKAFMQVAKFKWLSSRLSCRWLSSSVLVPGLGAGERVFTQVAKFKRPSSIG
ncbi:hypothetical protein DUNSADRAFT_2559 [Dunaliella salina]|uniref:Uncharacterized protein n=1 Tax=Dunaliella salina TaxID=3046 RepID=A0ABQ7GVC8_DUNSA|nr:hypothetical protein DUNSADRAFT_2559 [Dunaliella salina]|eukprot:KAF5838575.1 hypothetical protein DUNSADRAFT_2559 [Dunaliella salina]